MRVLCIATAAAYRGIDTDIPAHYARLAAEPGIELFHAESAAMMTDTEHVAATRIERGFDPSAFPGLAARGYSPLALREVDVVFCRTLKPFPPGYLEALARRGAETRFVNDPRGIALQIRHAFLLAAAAPFLPEHALVRDGAAARAFLSRFPDAVAKRENSCGGRGVFRLAFASGGRLRTEHAREGRREHADADAALASLLQAGPLLFMRFLPRVSEGDKRVVVVDGEIYGAYLRRATGGWVQNVGFGGRCEPAAVGDAERAIVAATAEAYHAAGLHVLGYDLLRDDDGGWRVSEINAGNVGGLIRLEGLGCPESGARFARWLRAFARRPAA